MCLFLLPLKINASIKGKLLERGPKNAELITFSDVVNEQPGEEWDTLLAKWIKENRGDTDGSSISSFTLSEQMSKLRLLSKEDFIQERAARGLISSIESQHNLYFLDSKFPLFGFMREVATNEKKRPPKLYLWQGKADAIAYSRKLNKYVIVDFKVVDNLFDYWKKKTDLYGKHLHQCLVYAKLLQLHMNLHYYPSSLIVVIHKVTGKDGYFALFEDYPKECYDKLHEYEWFTKQPSKRPLRIADSDKLLNTLYQYRGAAVVSPHKRLLEIFEANATVKDLLDSLGYDSLEIFQQKEQ